MILKPVPGAPGYYMDMDNLVPYSAKRGIIKPLSINGKYKSIHFYVDGKHIGCTVYRFAFAVSRNVDVKKIPGEYMITMRDGEIVVMTRQELNAETAQRCNIVREELKEREYKHVGRKLTMIKKYMHGDRLPLLKYLQKARCKIVTYMMDRHGLSKLKAEIISEMAINQWLDRFHDGVNPPSVYIYKNLIRLANDVRREERERRKAAIKSGTYFTNPIVFDDDFFEKSKMTAKWIVNQK